MFQSIFAAAGIESVAVGEEGLAPQRLDHIGHRPGIVRAQEAQVAQLAKMHFDGNKLAVHIDLIDAGGAQQPLQLQGQALAQLGPEVGVVNLGFFHGDPPFSQGQNTTSYAL